MFRRLLLVCALATGFAVVVPALEGTPAAEAGPAKTKKSSSKGQKTAKKKKKASGKVAARSPIRSNATSPKIKMCVKGKGKKKKCSTVREFQGHGVVASTLRKEPLDRPSGELWVRAENLNEEVKLSLYRADGSFDEDALAKLDVIFRCKRTGEVRSVDPRLYEQLSRIQDHFDHKRIDLVSGFRFAERNSSRHYHASAMDIRIEGVSIKDSYAFAQTLDQGGDGAMGIGIYPHSNFIHVDFRAPGDPSYRWTDYSGHPTGKAKRHKKAPGRTARAKKPTS